MFRRIRRFCLDMLIVNLMIATGGVLAQDYPNDHQAQVSTLANANAPTQKSTDPQGFTHWRAEINSGCSFSDHSYTLNVDAAPDTMSQISYTMSNWDVDYNDPQGCSGGPEVDLMSFNGHLLGTLKGANNSWSVNTWPLDKSQVIKGSNQIYIDTDSPNTGCWCVGVGYIEVIAKVGFEVQSHTPGKDEKNRAFGRLNVGIGATFTNKYDTKTLTNSTFLLEYRNTGGAWQPVPGSFEQTAPESFKFEPSDDLKDGVLYRVTIKGGKSGVKSLAGAEMKEDKQWSFWTVPNLDLTDSFGGNVCAPSADPCRGAEVAVFQVSRNAPLVEGKDAVARVFARWKKHTDVYDGDQVKELEADFDLTGGGVTKTQKAKVKRPDLYTSDDRKVTKNSVNIYHTPTSGVEYKVEIKPTPQSNSPPIKYPTTVNPGSTGKKPKIEFDYYFLKDGEWSNGVPQEAKDDGKNVFTAGANLINAQFPVLSTTYNEKPEYTIGHTYTGRNINFWGEELKEVSCPLAEGLQGPPAPRAEVYCDYLKLSGMLNGRRFVAATVPNGLFPGATAFAIDKKVIMHQYGAGGNDGTIAHEAGHIYGISTANNPNEGHRNDSQGVEGFQVNLGKNRSYTDDPDHAISLMHTTLQPQGTQWVHNDDYQTLIGTVPISAHRAATLSGGYLIVIGSVDLDLRTASLTPMFYQDTPNDAPLAGGTCQAALFDASGIQKSSVGFDPGATIHIDSFSGSDSVTQTAGPLFFSASVPWDNDAVELRIICNGTVLASQLRSPNAPTVAFVGLNDGDTLAGNVDIVWQGSDQDDPKIAYQLQISLDGGATWTPLMPLDVATHFMLNTTVLPSIPNARLSIMATDGFNTSYATAQVNIANALAVQGAIPRSGETNVNVNTPISVYFVSPVNEATLTASTFRVTAGGQAINGRLSYDAAGRIATFTPTGPLAHATVHTVELTSALQDQAGHPLTPTSWTFTTAEDQGAPQVTSVFPTSGDSAVPLNALVQVGFSEPVAPATLSTASLRLFDGAGAAVPGQVVLRADNRTAIFAASANLAADSSYRVVVTTDVTDTQGNPLAQQFESEFKTGTAPFDQLRIVGDYRDNAVDEDGDGFYDKLVISAAVEVSQSGSYNLNGRLLTPARDLIEWSSSGTVYLNYGITRLDLVFNSAPIRSSGVDGPYILDALNFYSASNPLIGDVVFDAFQTYPYPVAKFYSLMTLGPLPGQLLKVGTALDNAFNLKDFTTHRTQPLESITYQLLVNPVPAAGVSIDSNNFVDINPVPGTASESDVTIEARDQLGNKVQSTFHVSVQVPAPQNLVLKYANEMPMYSDQEIQVDIFDQFGMRFEAPTTVYFETTLGTVQPASVDTSTGKASATLSAGSVAGSAFLTVGAGNAESVVKIVVKDQYLLSVTKSGSGTVTSNDGGINCGLICAKGYNPGVSVKLTAAPAAGLTHWGGACASTVGNTCTLSMNSAKGVTADFTLAAPDQPIPIAPTGNIMTNRPTYTWNAVPTTSYYGLYVNDKIGNKLWTWYTAAQAGCASGTGTCAMTPWAPLASGQATWWVVAWNPAGLSPWSAATSFVIPGVDKPTKPITIAPTGSIANNLPTYRWNAVGTASYYGLYVNDKSGNWISSWYTADQASCANGTGTCTITPEVPLASGEANWWVLAWNPSGLGPWSDATSFTVPVVAIPAKPVTIAPSGSIDTILPTFSWNAVGTTSYYGLYVNDKSGNWISNWYTAAQANCSNGTGTCTITPAVPLASGKANWWVVGWNPSGLGPWSNTTAFTVPMVAIPAKPVTIAPSGAIATNQPTYTWSAVSQSAYYGLYVIDRTGNKIWTWYTAAQANCANGTGSCTITPEVPLASGKASWWVVGWNPSGLGPWSDATTFTVTN